MRSSLLLLLLCSYLLASLSCATAASLPFSSFHRPRPASSSSSPPSPVSSVPSPSSSSSFVSSAFWRTFAAAAADVAAESSSTGDSCDTSADCNNGLQECVSGVCRAFSAPDDSCKLNGVSQCEPNEECQSGLCQPKPTQITCRVACDASKGQVCNLVTGMCVSNGRTDSAVCDPACASGESCRATAFGGVTPICVPSTAATCDASNPCSGDQEACVLGVCSLVSSCGDLCDQMDAIYISIDPDAHAKLLHVLGGLGVTPSMFDTFKSSTEGLLDEDSRGTLFPAGKSFIDLHASSDGTPQTIKAISFTNSDPAVVRVTPGKLVSLDRVSSTSAQARLMLPASARLDTSLSVAFGAKLLIGFGSVTDPISLLTSVQQVIFQSMELTGELDVVSSSLNSMVTFPSKATLITVAEGASIRLAGQMSLEGHMGKAAVVINSVAGQGLPHINVGFWRYLTIDGSIVSSVPGASLVLQGGQLSFGGRHLQVDLKLKGVAGVSFTLSPTSIPTYTRKVGFEQGAANIAMLMSIHGEKTSTKDGASLFMEELENCPALSSIMLYVPRAELKAASRKSFTVLNYGTATYTHVKSLSQPAAVLEFGCLIRLCPADGTDRDCIEVRNSKGSGSGGGAYNDDMEWVASWEPTKLTINRRSLTEEEKRGGNAAGVGAQVTASLLIILAALVMKMMRI